MASQVIVEEIFKGAVQRDFSYVFICMDMPRPENESLLNIKFFRNSENFKTGSGVLFEA
jgi:hypothetical protein